MFQTNSFITVWGYIHSYPYSNEQFQLRAANWSKGVLTDPKLEFISRCVYAIQFFVFVSDNPAPFDEQTSAV